LRCGNKRSASANDSQSISPRPPEIHDCGDQQIHLHARREDAGEVEAGGKDPHNGHRLSIHRHRLADDCGIGGKLILPEVITQHCRRTAALLALFLGETASQRGFNAERRKKVIGNFHDSQLPGLSIACQLVLDRTIESLICGDGLKGPVIPLEFLVGICRIGLPGKTSRGLRLGRERFASPEPDESLRIREWQWTQQQHIHHAEYSDIGADAQCQNKNRHGGETRVIAKVTESVANVPIALNPVVLEAFPAFHLPSQVLSDFLHGVNISELAFSFVASGATPPPLTNQIVRLGFKVKTQLVLDVCRWIWAEQTGVASPKRNWLHACSSDEFSPVAPRTLATATE